MRKMTQRALRAAGFALVLATTGAFAQQTPPTRIRGVIEKVDGNTLTIKARNGSDMTVKMADNYTVMAFVKASMADILSSLPTVRNARSVSIFLPRRSAAPRKASALGICGRTAR